MQEHSATASVAGEFSKPNVDVAVPATRQELGTAEFAKPMDVSCATHSDVVLKEVARQWGIQGALDGVSSEYTTRRAGER